MTTRIGARHGGAALAAAALALAACRGVPPPAAAPAPTADAPGDRYVVRGQISRLAPPEAGPGLSIRHEEIPSFKDKEGAVVGMMPMTMFFPVAKEVPLAGLFPGDKIRFRFVMDWQAARFEIEWIEKLPPETVLDFGDGRR